MIDFFYKIALLTTLFFYLILSKLILFIPLNSKKVTNSYVYLASFFPENAGYHWRVKKWANLLENEGYIVEIKQALSKEEFYRLRESNMHIFLLKYLHRRFWQVIKSRNIETVIVRRELLLYNDYGNLFLDKLLLKIHPNAILDFDDDIAYAKNEPRKVTSTYGKVLQEKGNKFTESLSMYQNFIVGSNYLEEYVLKRNSKAKIQVIPTCVDYEIYTPKKYNLDKKTITFGWVGGNHNLFLLENIIEPLNKISSTSDIELLVISAKEYVNDKAKFKIINKQWSLETEIEDIKQIDIGLMPLLNTKRDKGKAGFKLIQYMGLGVVSIASAVTINKEIIDDLENGFLVYEEAWDEILIKTIQYKSNYDKIGKMARIKINQNYSFKSNLVKYLYFIQSFK